MAAFFAVEFEQWHAKPPDPAKIVTRAKPPLDFGGILRSGFLILQVIPVTDRAAGGTSAGFQSQLGKNELYDDEVQNHENDELFHFGPSRPFSWFWAAAQLFVCEVY